MIDTKNGEEAAPAVEAGEGKEGQLRSQVETAMEIIKAGIAIMTDEQVGQWRGVRAFLEQDTDDYSPSAIRLAQEEMRERAANEAMKWNYQSGANNRDRKACAEECAERIRSLPTQPVATEDS